MDEPTIKDAIDVACKELKSQLMNESEGLLIALQNTIGDNDGDSGTVSIGTKINMQGENGKLTIDVDVKGSFVEARCKFASETKTVGDPDPDQGKLDLDDQKPEPPPAPEEPGD